MAWLLSQAMVNHCESLRYSQGQAAEFSPESCSAGEPFAPSNATNTPQAYLCGDKTMDCWRRFPSGMTCERLTAGRGEELLTLFREAFLVPTSAPRDGERESTANSQDYGAKWRGSLAKYDRDSRSWKTRQCLLGGGLAEFSATWPRWGTMQDGASYLRKTPSFLLAIRAFITSEKESGSSRQIPTVNAWDGKRGAESRETKVKRGSGGVNIFEALKKLPTPRATDGKKGGPNQRESKGDLMLPSAVAKLPTPYGLSSNQGQGGGSLNPDWVEWLMGWPIGWTSLAQMSVADFDSWLTATRAGTWWHSEPEGIPRTASKIPQRAARLRAIGNGQVPQAAALAWNILTTDRVQS